MFLITITSRIDLHMFVCPSYRMNAVISETIKAAILGLSMQILETPAQRKIVSSVCPLLHSQTAQACGAHNFHARKIFKLNFMISQYNWQMYIIACILKELLNYFIVSLFFYLFIYILALQVYTYNYRASHIELIFYIFIIFKLLKQFLSLS